MNSDDVEVAASNNLNASTATAICQYLEDSLVSDRKDLSDLKELLNQERSALKACEVAALEKMASKKLELAQALEKRSSERTSSLSNYGLICYDSKSWLNTIETIEALAGKSIWSTWQEVELLLKEADELSRINEKIVNAMQHSANQFVGLIRQESGNNEVLGYSQSGRTATSSTSAHGPLASA